jgi:hypothetical protein
VARWLLFLPLLILGGCGGCGCPGGSVRCEGDSLEACATHTAPDPWTYVTTQWEVIANCGPGLCDAKTPGCTLSNTPDPSCNPSLATEEVCDGGAVTSCNDGYAALTLTCGWCGSDGGLLCRGYIGDDCSQMPCAPQLTCHAFTADGGSQQSCSAACQAPADCVFTTGRGGGLGDGGGPGPTSNWAGPGAQNPNCVGGWCVPGPI